MFESRPVIISLIILQLYSFSAFAVPVTGFLPEDPKSYAAMPQVAIYRDFFAPEADLSAYFPRPGDQGQQTSCTAWATAYAARTYHEAKQQGVPPKDTTQSFSPAYIYNQLQPGRCNTFTTLSDALDLLKKRGVPRLTDFPYDQNNCSRIPNATVISEAVSFRIDDWKRVDEDNLDSIKGQIFSGTPVIFGLEVSESFTKLQKGQIYTDLTSKRIGGHAMVLVGYSESKQAFKLINSWGDNWADNGYGWISYKAFRKWVQNTFVMEVAGVPVPTVKPEPVVMPRPSNITNTNIEQKLTDLLSKADCSHLTSTVNAQGNVTLSGFARKSEDLAFIRSELATLGSQVTLNTELRPWPQCEVLLTLHDVLAHTHDLQLSVSGQKDATLKKDDSLVIELTTPSYASYLYLSYVQVNGEVVHLVRPQGATYKPIAPYTHLVFGNGEAGNGKFKISPPFGDEMLVAIASSTPLFDVDLPKKQIEREYLTQFRQAFLANPYSGNSGRVFSAAVVTMLTRSK